MSVFAMSFLSETGGRVATGPDGLSGRTGVGSELRQDPVRGRGRSATGFLTLMLVLLVTSSARAGIIFTDSFEEGKKFADPTGYGGRLAAIQSSNPRTGSNALFLNNKEGALYTLADTYQLGTYTVSYYARREASFANTYSILSYGITGFLAGNPELGGIFLEEAQLPIGSYKLVTYSATVAAGSLAIGKQVQVLVDQSRLGASDGLSQLRIDDVSVSFTPAGAGVVPEPSSMAILGLGALVIAYRARRKTKSQQAAVQS